MPVLEVMPDAVTAYRAYLLDVDQITAQVANRIRYGALIKDEMLPAIRISDVITTEDVPHAWARALLQFDVWHSAGRQKDCRALAELLRAALRASTGHVAESWVLGGPDTNGVSAAPFGDGVDTSIQPPDGVPRYVVQSGLLIRPS